MTIRRFATRASYTGAAVVACLAAQMFADSALGQTVLRLSTTGQPQSEEVAYAEKFAAEVAERTDGRVEIRVHPANALGDWSDIEEYVIQGAVEMALQPLGARFGSAGILNNFPFITTDEVRAEAQMVLNYGKPDQRELGTVGPAVMPSPPVSRLPTWAVHVASALDGLWHLATMSDYG